MHMNRFIWCLTFTSKNSHIVCILKSATDPNKYLPLCPRSLATLDLQSFSNQILHVHSHIHMKRTTIFISQSSDIISFLRSNTYFRFLATGKPASRGSKTISPATSYTEPAIRVIVPAGHRNQNLCSQTYPTPVTSLRSAIGNGTTFSKIIALGLQSKRVCTLANDHCKDTMKIGNVCCKIHSFD